MPCHGAGNGVVERWPATSTLELVLRSVERRIATGASIHAGIRSVLVVLADEGSFGAFLAENTELFCWRVLLV